MYSVVLATMLAVGGDAPSFGHHRHHGCHGCHGCYGCYGSSCHGCWGGGCYGCYGSSCHGCWGGSCHGCWGGSCSGCYGGCYGSISYGCHGCLGGVWGCYGCSGCYGGGYTVAAPAVYGCSGCYGSVAAAPVVAAPIAAAPVLAAPAAGVSAPDFNNSLTPQEVEQFRKYMREKSGSKALAPSEARGSAAPANAARLTVKLPADARLWVDHVECPLTSDVRAFNTPALPAGQTFAYTLKVEVNRDGQTLTDSQRVRVTAGQRVDVDFSNVDRVATARR